MSTQLNKFIKTLEELFQFDQADLDFGIYRIMNQKRDEVTRFLNQEIVPQVKKAFEKYKHADIETIKQEIEKLEKQLSEMGVAKESSEKYKTLTLQLNRGIDITAMENEVYSDLANFFKRYYDAGDFISLRRYKKDVYSIPYQGEEVKLYWANSDQYYVKSSENFSDYTFTLPSEKQVHFKLVDADTEQNNNKEQEEKERRFILINEEPLIEENDQLFVKFKYVPDEQKRTREKINADTIERIFSLDGFEKWIEELKLLSPTEKNKNRTLLEKHLNDYTAKNSFDYFVHKDLGRFLSRELDYYIKNEIMHLDDLDTENEKRFEQYLSKVKVIRSIGKKIIKFLSQIEEFQKKLWLKKKFVVETNYCITLDKVPEEFYEEILNNQGQIEEWKTLFAIDEIENNITTIGYSIPLSKDFLKENPYLIIDTKFFNQSFKRELLSNINNVNEDLDGLLIYGENFQALNLIINSYKDKVDMVLVDPPYNTKSDKWLYKDGYKHSSWLSLMDSRLAFAKELLKNDGSLFMHIDENEHTNASLLLSNIFGINNQFGDIIWKNSSKNDENYISMQHEYIVGAVKDKSQNSGDWTERKEGLEEIYNAFAKFKNQYGNDWKAIHSAALEWFNQFPDSNPVKNSKHYTWMDERGIYFPDNIAGPNFGQYRYPVIHPVTGKECKEPASGWRYPEETMKRKIEEGLVHFGDDETTVPKNKTYLKNTEYQSLTSMKYKDGRVASKLLESMFGEKVFSNPKDVELEGRIIKAVLKSKQPIILDFFGGSGTSAHSIISLNREDNEKRRYILVEMGEYFKTVLKPRILKAVYSKDWKDGKPVSREGSSHMFKYIQLESYEDALNNIELKRTAQQELALKEHMSPEAREDYYLSYMLDIESEGSSSLINIDEFKNPFDYKMKINNGGETKFQRIDLVETFNYLLGLHVTHIDFIRGFQVISGELRTGENVLIIWRNLIEATNDELEEFFVKQGYNSLDLEFDRIYVNGDNHLENLKLDENKWKVVLIEEEFKRLMFDIQDV